MILIVGLGNIGEKYAQSRHNLGFMVLDELAREMLSLAKTQWQESKKFNSLIIKHPSEAGSRSAGQPLVILVKPQTMMNASGFAVAKMANFYHIEPAKIWVIHDDVDLPLGKIKIRLGGGSGGHRGIDSIIEQLGTDKFVRFRLGIGHPGRGSDKLVERYVLRSFDVHEVSELRRVIKKTAEAIKTALDEDLEKAMNRFNFK